MERQLNVAYETVGASSYMKFVCPPETVHYEMEMILSNEIKNFLSVSRQTADGETVLYYNITSRIPLSDLLGKRKLARKEFLCLINGAALAVQDAAEFRLPEEKIFMDPEQVYINPATCEPAFMFVPTEEPAGFGLRELITGLILKDQIELSGDNLIQVLLKEVNRQPFSAAQLEIGLRPYLEKPKPREIDIDLKPASVPILTPESRGNSLEEKGNFGGEVPRQENMFSEKNRYPEEDRYLKRNRGPEENRLPKKGRYPEPNERPEKVKLPEKNKFSKKNRRPEKEKRKTDLREQGKEKEFDSEKAKKLFLLPQALVMVLVAAGVSFGFFRNESGGLAVNVILAFVIVIALAETILYREIFVNGRTADGKPTEKKKKTRQSKPLTLKKERPIPGRMPERTPEMPGRTPERLERLSAIPRKASEMPEKLPEVPVRMPEIPGGISAGPGLFAPQVSPMEPEGILGFEHTDPEGETEMWGGAETAASAAYLEYFEDGKLNRIPINPENGTVIGRLRSQVDFAVRSPKVGKIHAKFSFRDGEYFVTDINSKNGTYLNGSRSRIDSNVPYPLQDKDRISLADCEFTIRCTTV